MTFKNTQMTVQKKCDWKQKNLILHFLTYMTKLKRLPGNIMQHVHQIFISSIKICIVFIADVLMNLHLAIKMLRYICTYVILKNFYYYTYFIFPFFCKIK